MLGIKLTDTDVFAVPLLRTDPYGNFIPDLVDRVIRRLVIGLGGDGIPNTADDMVDQRHARAAPAASLTGAVRTDNAFTRRHRAQRRAGAVSIDRWSRRSVRSRHQR